MFTKLLTLAGIACVLAINPLGEATAQPNTERVHFAPGTSGATLTGRLGSEQAIRYVLGARNEQFLTVSLRPDNQYTYYIIYVPGGDILFESSQGGNEYYGQLYKSGDHVVEVFYKGEPRTFGNYDILFEISASGARSSGPAPAQPQVSEAETACLAAVANQVGNGDVSVISVETAESGTMVHVRVPGAQKPWSCFYDGAQVGNVFYEGEG